jgi:single-stranded-DNA-specific exonuclease
LTDAPARILRRTPPAGGGFGAHLHPLLRRVYAARGVGGDAELDLSLRRLLPVSSLPGVDAAARLLAEHRDSGRVLIVGDFDADGATSTALMVRALRAMQFAHVDFLVPNRFRFGYGLTPEIVALAVTRRPTLIVTVDNGVSSLDGVEAAHAAGIPVLVTDHHLPGTTLPRAAAIVNPNLRGGAFPSGALAGVGVAFYVVVALARVLAHADFKPAELLDLVALGTVADVVPLDHNNRVLVAQGLRRIRAGRCVPGIRALLESASRPLERVAAADLGFAVGPRLNAAGRLTDMSIGIACLLADDAQAAQGLAAQLTRLNAERREIEQRMQLEAVDLATALQSTAAGAAALGLCLFDPTWHQGVVGLVAGRVKDRWHRPVIAFARADDGALRGSARSVAGVHIRDALAAIAAQHPGLIEKFGGHAMAAGLTLAESDLTRFSAEFAAEIARRTDRDALQGVIHSDGELAPVDLCLTVAKLLAGAGPWGQGFPEPVFDGAFEVSDARIIGDRHLKLKLRAGPRCEPLDAIAFGYLGGASESAEVRAGARVEVAYRLEVNEYKGVERLQLHCLHLMPV